MNDLFVIPHYCLEKTEKFLNHGTHKIFLQKTNSYMIYPFLLIHLSEYSKHA